MHDQPKLVGYGNQLAWNCLLLACMKIEHFHHKNLVHSGTRNSIKIYRGSSKSICNLRYAINNLCFLSNQHWVTYQIKTRCIIKKSKVENNLNLFFLFV